jgi:soluble lytic murein transglycosylase-like protein
MATDPGSIFVEEDSAQPFAPVRIAPAPRTGFIENVAASYHGVRAVGRLDSRELSLREAYDPVVDALNAGFRRANVFAGEPVSPDAERMFRNPYRGREINPNFDAWGGVPYQERRIWAEITRRRQHDPHFLESLGRNRDDFIQRVNERARRDFEAEAETRDRATTLGTIGSFVGSLAGGFSDPVNLGAMMFGLGPARSIAQTAIREAFINAGIEAVSTPMLADRRREVGAPPMTLGEAVENIAAAGALGAGVGTTVEGARRTIARLRGRPIEALSNRELADEIEAMGEVSPELRDAHAVLSEAADVEESNPGAATPHAQAEHVAQLSEAIRRAASDELPPADIPAPDEAQARRLAAFEEPGGEGQRDQIAQLTHNIRAALDARRAAEADGGQAGTALARTGAEASTAPDFETSWRAIIGNEAGTGPNGAFRTSPKGAIGPAQVMPGTAREAARLAGLPWDDHRYRTDHAYNVALGRAYYEDLLRQFDGDPVKAAAAYNAGPGSARRGTGLRGAMARAERAGEPGNWEAYLPAETQRYVRDFRRRTGADRPAFEGEGVALSEEVVDGEAQPVVRPLRELLDEHDADDHFINELEACLR